MDEREKVGLVLLRLPRTLKESLTRAAKHEGVSLNQFLVFVLSREIGKREGDKNILEGPA